jgi:hypothetical protein
LTLKAVDPTAMLTQGAVDKRFQVIFLVHILPRYERLLFLFYSAFKIDFVAIKPTA